MPDDSAIRPPGHAGAAGSIESRTSWIAAGVTLAILSVSYGAPLLVVVGLRPMQEALGTDRSVLALATAFVWMGTGLGGIVMGRVADRVGVRATTLFGAVMMAAGLAASATGHVWVILAGHLVLVGLLGNGAIYPPLVIHVSRCFDRRRGTAIALISSGQYVAGVLWPWLIERTMTRFGWQAAMLGFAVIVLAVVLPLAFFLHPAPDAPLPRGPGVAAAPRSAARVLGLPPNAVQALLCVAGFLCCVPMAIPSAHLVAYCGDLGIDASQGAAMFSLLLGCAFVSRQFWGLFADRFGGLACVMTGSALQAVAIAAFLPTRGEAGLFAVSAAFGLGFSGIIPAYVVTIRELFPSAEASWRVPLMMLTSMAGMAFGSWFAGMLYDSFGFYAPAFGSGVLFNLGNLVVVGFLLARQPGRGRQPGGLPASS